jgi:hypothetical protein
MANTDYANTDAHLVAPGGGRVRTIVGAGATVQGNGGTVLPCKVVYMNALGGNAVHCAINTSTNVSQAVMIPTQSTTSVGNIGHLELPIDDVSKLWFNSAGAASVLITYRY